jgi:hypothetical protein
MEPLGGRFAAPRHRHGGCRSGQPRNRHARVDRLGSLDEIGLVPDADRACSLMRPAVECSPGWTVSSSSVACIVVQLLVRVPVLHQERSAGAEGEPVTEQAGVLILALRRLAETEASARRFG